MPQVTLISSNGISRIGYGGCFGFTGRSGSTSGFGNIGDLFGGSDTIETYRYHIGEQWGGKNEAGLNSPIPYLKWLCNKSSWAKYFKDYSFPNDKLPERAYVDIRTDIPGHCIIGAASAARLAHHRFNTLIPFWNLATNAGADGAIALLVFYALGQYVDANFNITPEGELQYSPHRNRIIISPPTSSSGTLSLSDDEVMDLSNVSPGMLYSFIEGSFEMVRNDMGSEVLYQNSPTYDQDILNSFRARDRHKNRKNLGSFLLSRFHTTLTGPDVHKFSGGSGAMGTRIGLQATRKAPINLSTLIGWSLQLTSEFKQYGRFLGWRC